MYTVTIPYIGRLVSFTLDALAEDFEVLRDSWGYGYSDIGGRWEIQRNGYPFGTLSYNGRTTVY